MSVKLTTQDLTGATVGTTGSFDWTPYVQVRSQAMPQEPSAHLMVRNDTGAALDVRFPLSGKSNYISPGQWPTFTLAPDETGMTYTVESIIAGGNYAKLAAIYYAPGEELDDIGSLGNSPLSGNVTTPFSPANEFEQDFLTGFVLTGLVCTKDGSIVNQLDVTSGVAFLKQADSGWGRVAPNATTFLTATPSTTYFLDLNPDGSFSFATTHSAVSNHITICSLTTDGSGNILVVTDARALNTTLFTNMLGSLGINSILTKRGGLGVLGTLVPGDALDIDSSGNLYLKVPASMAINFQSPNGSTQTEFGGNALGILKLGGQAAVGNFGVPVIVAQALRVSVTVTTLVTILTYSIPTNGLYRLNGAVLLGNTASSAPKFHYTFTNAAGNADSGNFTGTVNSVPSPAQSLDFNETPFNITPWGTINGSMATVIQANVGTLTVTYQTTGTPNDLVSVVIERLA